MNVQVTCPECNHEFIGNDDNIIGYQNNCSDEMCTCSGSSPIYQCPNCKDDFIID